MNRTVDVDVAAVAALIGDPARAAMLQVLMDGTQRPAGELARAAKVTAATASEHLRRLLAADLITVRSSGRNRFYALSSPRVAAALESLALIAAPRPITSLRQSRSSAAMSEARSCYDHLAGRAGVALRLHLIESGVLEPDGPRDHALTVRGEAVLEQLGISVTPLRRSNRLLARDCLDLTERQPHLAGSLPATLLNRFLELSWLSRRGTDRALTMTSRGQADLLTFAGPRQDGTTVESA